jgi:hypothetical protein
MSEYMVNIWSKVPPTFFKPIPRVHLDVMAVEAEDHERAAETAHAIASTPDRLIGRSLPRVYVEVVRDGGPVCRLGDLGLKLEHEVRGSVTR